MGDTTSKSSDSSVENNEPQDNHQKELKNFKFRTKDIYSHQDRTIVIDATSYGLLDELINYEITQPHAKENGFIVLHFGSDYQPITTDESIFSLLIDNGDHQEAKHEMTPDKYTYQNVLSKEEENPTGVFCAPNLLESVSSGKRLNSEKEKTTKTKINSRSTSKDGSAKMDALENAETVDNSEEEDDDVDDDDANQDAVITIKGADDIPPELGWKLQCGQLVSKTQKNRSERQCPCLKQFNRSCVIINRFRNSTTKRPLFHAAYLGHLRLEGIIEKYSANLKSNKSRLFDSDLLKCEGILRYMLDCNIKTGYNYEYLLHKKVIKINPPETSGAVFGSSVKYDMRNGKNYLDACVDGDCSDGISSPWTYVGFGGSIFPTHLEDLVYLNSINYMAYGCSKVWIFVAPEHGPKLQECVVQYLNSVSKLNNFSKCTLQHKLTFIHPGLLEKWGIPFKVVVQKPGNLIVTMAGSYHWGFNLGVNLNYAKNTIQDDFKLGMLDRIYCQQDDEFLCNQACIQRPSAITIGDKLNKFLVAFYASLFIASPYQNTKPLITGAMFRRYFSLQKDGAIEEELKAELNKAIEGRKQRLKVEMLENEEKILKFLQRISCPMIEQKRVTITVGLYSYAGPPASDDTLYPRKNFKLPIAKQNCLFNKLPYNHITIRHDKYGTNEEMGFPENASLIIDENTGYVVHEFQFLDQLRHYWTDFTEGKHYKVEHTHQTGENHTDLEKDVDILKAISSKYSVSTPRKKRKLAPQKETNSKLINFKSPLSSVIPKAVNEAEELENDSEVKESIMEREVAGPSTEPLDEQSNQQNEEHSKKKKRKKYYEVLGQSGKIKLLLINEKHYFICGVCFTNIEEHLDKATCALIGERNETLDIAFSLEKKIKSKDGVFSDVTNIRHHVSAQLKRYFCLVCNTGKFTSKYTLSNHIRIKHQAHSIYCPMCPKSFKQVKQLRKHWSNPKTACVKVDIGEGKGKQVEVQRFACSACMTFMAKPEQFKEHLLRSSSCRAKLSLVEDGNKFRSLEVSSNEASEGGEESDTNE